NNGSGTFAAAASYSYGTTGTYHLTAADVNLDGKQDLAVASYGGNRLSTLLGNGDGTFQTAVVYSYGNNPMGVAAGDYNEDGRPDLATGHYGGSNLTVLVGNNVRPLTPA